MKAICVEITKVIVITVEAENYDGAISQIAEQESDGECGQSWDRAEPQYKLLDESEVSDV
jgi:hypothetical protein